MAAVISPVLMLFEKDTIPEMATQTASRHKRLITRRCERAVGWSFVFDMENLLDCESKETRKVDRQVQGGVISISLDRVDGLARDFEVSTELGLRESLVQTQLPNVIVHV